MTAEDYGYAPAYGRGILEAVAAGAVDSVSAMVLRPDCDPTPLQASGVEVGLHLELPGVSAWGTAWAGAKQRSGAVRELDRQLREFEQLFGRPPAYVDGHRHCHAAPGLASAIARSVRARGLPLRSIDTRHRRTLRGLGLPTPDRLVGRLQETEPALPAELLGVVEGVRGLPPGVTEWMTHPGHRDPRTGSAYDRGREEDLGLLLRLRLCAPLAAARGTHAVLLAG